MLFVIKKGGIKMNRFLKLFSAFILLLGLSGVADATIINYDFAVVDGNNYTSPHSGVTVETFDTTPSFNWSLENGAVVSGSLTNYYAAPFGVSSADTTNYMTVPFTGGSGSKTATFTEDYNYFGIWWGSVDAYNTLTFKNGDAEVASFTGSSITNLPNGDQTVHLTNRYVNFLDLPLYNSFTITSNGYAFEADNIAVGNVSVPEPTTMLLLGFGLIGLAVSRRTVKG
jgi:hypothetical protein